MRWLAQAQELFHFPGDVETSPDNDDDADLPSIEEIYKGLQVNRNKKRPSRGDQ
jgi:hypothetical protein